MYSGVAGAPIGYLREGRKNIPIVQLMEYGQRETVTDLGQLYVYSSQTPVRLTLGQIARLTYSLKWRSSVVSTSTRDQCGRLTRPGSPRRRGDHPADVANPRFRTAAAARLSIRDRPVS